MDFNKLRFATRQIHAGLNPAEPTGSRGMAIYPLQPTGSRHAIMQPVCLNCLKVATSTPASRTQQLLPMKSA